MTNLIVEISKYLMILLMAVYTYANFRVFSPKDEKKTGWGCRAQCGAMFAIHFLAYLVMYLSREDPAVRSALAAFYCAQAVFFLCYICFSRLIYRNISRLLVNNSCMLLCTGLIMLTRLSLDAGWNGQRGSLLLLWEPRLCPGWFHGSWGAFGSFTVLHGPTQALGSGP